jgi:hypothetical protein
MTPTPTLQDLINSTRSAAPGQDALGQLSQARQTVTELEEISDALLGYFVDQSRRSGRSWAEISAALGVTRQAAHKRFSASALSLEDFTRRARAVLEAAAESARTLRHAYVGTEHLLLGLFGPDDGIAARVLAAVGITETACQELVVTSTKRGRVVLQGELPFTPRADDALRGASKEALALGHDYIGTEHLLLSLFGVPEGLAATVLGELGASYDDVRSRVIGTLAGYEGAEG